MEELNAEFISKLTKLYGSFDKANNKFKKASNSEIARELGYSDAQFSRLINNHATKGEYIRANQNVDRILALIDLKAQLGKTRKKTPKNQRLSIRMLIGFIGLVIGVVLGYMLFFNTAKSENQDQSKYEMLKWSFENAYINPYTKLKELPSDCKFPCYKYQGKWELKNEYKLPFFRERNGFHYLATEAIMYARCMGERSPKGDILEGYEYQKHEIWYDTEEIPIDSFLIGNSDLKPFYMAMDFNKQKNFVKIATIHTFYKDEFTIDSTVIHRTGRDVGRDIEFISKSELSTIFSDQNVTTDLVNEINMITRDPLNDFSKPSSCNPSPVVSEDFHTVNEGGEMTFNCQMTTSRVKINYTKVFVLKDQYIKNTCRDIID